MNWFSFEFSAFLWTFIILNVINVIIQTIKSIATVKCGKGVAALTNALAFGLYTIVVVFMNADGLGLLWKALIIGLANLVGVFVVKLIEEKSRKDKLWKVEATIARGDIIKASMALELCSIPHNFIMLENCAVLNCYCATQKQSATVRDVLTEYGAKFFVSESKPF